jgi:hypothetical protein
LSNGSAKKLPRGTQLDLNRGRKPTAGSRGNHPCLFHGAAHQIDEAIGSFLRLPGVGYGIRLTLDGAIEPLTGGFGRTPGFLFAAALLLGFALTSSFLFSAALLLGLALTLGFLLAATLLLGFALTLGLLLATALLLGFALTLGLLLATALLLGLALTLGFLLAATLLLGFALTLGFGFLLTSRLLFGALLSLLLALTLGFRRGFLLTLTLRLLLLAQPRLTLGFLGSTLGLGLGFLSGLLQPACFFLTRRLLLLGFTGTLFGGLTLGFGARLFLGLGLTRFFFLARLLFRLPRRSASPRLLGALGLVGGGLGADQRRLHDGGRLWIGRLTLRQGDQTQHHDQHVQADSQQSGHAIADRLVIAARRAALTSGHHVS